MINYYASCVLDIAHNLIHSTIAQKYYDPDELNLMCPNHLNPYIFLHQYHLTFIPYPHRLHHQQLQDQYFHQWLLLYVEAQMILDMVHHIKLNQYNHCQYI